MRIKVVDKTLCRAEPDSAVFNVFGKNAKRLGRCCIAISLSKRYSRSIAKSAIKANNLTIVKFRSSTVVYRMNGFLTDLKDDITALESDLYSAFCIVPRDLGNLRRNSTSRI
jgi:hypothetical protein